MKIYEGMVYTAKLLLGSRTVAVGLYNPENGVFEVDNAAAIESVGKPGSRISLKYWIGKQECKSIPQIDSINGNRVNLRVLMYY